MDYLDASLIVAAISKEKKSPDIQVWLATRRPGSLCASYWTIAEVSSALALKLRSGEIGIEDRRRALATVDKLIDEILVMQPTSQHDLQKAARFVDREETKLRAGDALHLAIAQSCNARVCTLDQRLAAAGLMIGVRTLLL